ncbi:hypothetical protein ACNHUS_32535 [Actinomycetes bacterium M1A6_2h]
MTTVSTTKATAAATSRSGHDASPTAGRGSGTAPDSVVLTYELADTHLTATLVDVADGSQRGDARTMDLEDLSPEQIGLTVPMLWELLDRAKVKPGTVVVLGDVNTATVSPILELALGVPVVATKAPTTKTPTAKAAAQKKPAATAATTRPVPAKRVSTKTKTAPVAATAPVPGKPVPAKPQPNKPVSEDETAQTAKVTKTAGVAAVAATAESTKVRTDKKLDKPVAAPVETTEPPTEEIAVVPPLVSTYAFAEADVTAPVAVVAPALPPSTPAASTAAEGRGRRNLVIAAAATAVVLAGGIGAALALSNGSSSSVPEQAPSAATQDVSPATVAPPAAPSAQLPSPAAVPPPAAPAVPVAPAAEPAPVDSSNSSNSAPPAWTPTRAPAAQSPSTQAPVAPAPQSSSSYVPPPQFTVPVPVPDPNNPNATPQELQDEAWQRHWQQTGQYLEQQFG